MKRNRYILCLLVCGFMLYFAAPRLSITAPGAQGIFSIVWLIFALCVIAGNLTGVLYYPKKQVQQPKRKMNSKRPGKKSRYYY